MKSMLASGVRWFDDWFAIEDVAPGVLAIGEPRFHQINWNYLIVGHHRALLFDTGPGVRDISVVVRRLTTLPVAALPSHLHFDHTGGLAAFGNIAMADLPILRACDHDGIFHASDELFRGFREGMTWTPIRVRTWLPVGSSIDLGGRSLEILHTPGHSPDSISLFDAKAELFFAADFVYPGPLYAQIPGANLADYHRTAKILSDRLPRSTRIFCAHGAPDEAGEHRAPVLGVGDIRDLDQSLTDLKASGKQPGNWPVNAAMHLLLGADAFGPWQAP